MPAMKLTPPNSAISTRKPTRPSERCGVSTAEKIVGSRSLVVGGHGAQYTGNHGEKIGPQIRCRKDPQGQGAKASLRQARKPSIVKAALAQCRIGPMRRSRKRSAASRRRTRSPRANCKHINPFTLLVAVVLSAQATDAGVNKATPALFALADTPEKMVALGEERVRELIKTIGLFRTKAKNVVALSRKLVAEHGGQVPRSREALEALPGVGRKTANVVLNMAFGEPTIAVDTHIFRVGNRTGLAPGKNPFEVEQKLEQVVPAQYKLHAHHWLILHGRYTCVARKPLCEKCIIADLCQWPGKTVAAQS